MRFGPSQAALLVGAFSVALFTTAPLVAQKAIQAPGAGLEFKPPKGWLELPIGGDRQATVRLFCAPRAVASKEASLMPLLRVMFFAKGGDASQDLTDELPRRTAFRSLEDFLQRNYGGKNIEREPVKIDNVEGERLLVKGLTLERAVVGIRVPLADGEAAVCFEIPELQLDKMKKELDGTLSSLGVIERKTSDRLDPPQWAAEAWAKLDEPARKASRRKWAEALVAAAEMDSGEGFKAYKSKYWTVLSAADAGFTKKAITTAEAMRAWLEKKMPEFAKEAPMPAVLRIFDNPEQCLGLQSTGTDNREYRPDQRELLFAKDRDNGGATGYGQLLRAVLWHMFDDVDPHVIPSLPRWLDNGCWELLRSTKCDGKKVEFFVGDVEKGRIEHQQRNNSMPALWELMQEHIQPSPTDGSTEKPWGYTPECSRLMRWLWIDDGLKAFDKPTLVVDYVRGIAAAHAKVGPDPTRDVAAIGLTDAQSKERNVRFYKWRDAMLTAINDIATPLQPEAWRAVSDKWLDYNAKYK